MPPGQDSSGKIVVIDYGAGNLRSILKALERVCTERGSSLIPVVSGDPGEVERAAAVVLPGVGAAGPTMDVLGQAGLIGPLRDAATEAISGGRPFLGVCLGLQLLFDEHEEGNVLGLGVLRGAARKLPDGVKVPHIGWNRLFSRPHPMLDGIAPGAYFYYVHSYYVEPTDTRPVIGTTEYGTTFCGVLAAGNLWATQFHPEKSGPDGLRLLGNFVANVESGRQAIRAESAAKAGTI